MKIDERNGNRNDNSQQLIIGTEPGEPNPWVRIDHKRSNKERRKKEEKNEERGNEKRTNERKNETEEGPTLAAAGAGLAVSPGPLLVVEAALYASVSFSSCREEEVKWSGVEWSGL
jgi:hypothetical protein